MEDQASYLNGLVRAGVLSPSRLRVAALCEHKAAQIATGIQQPRDTLSEILRDLDEVPLALAVAAAAALESVLGSWAARFPDDPRPGKALELSLASIRGELGLKGQDLLDLLDDAILDADDAAEAAEEIEAVEAKVAWAAMACVRSHYMRALDTPRLDRFLSDAHWSVDLCQAACADPKAQRAKVLGRIARWALGVTEHS